jgi:Gpi18-like mannosyltransferase
MSQFKKFIVMTILLGILMLFFIPKVSMQGDMDYWIRWIGWIKEVGLSNIYSKQEVNYFPVYIYILYFFGLFFNNQNSLADNIYLIKCILILFNISAVLVSGYILYKNKINPIWATIIFLNPAFLYVSLIWGQIESLYMFFVLCSILFTFKNKVVLSSVFFALALYSKLQAIIFLPIIIILFIPSILTTKKINYIQILKILLGFLCCSIVIFLIFYNSIGAIFQNVLKSVDLFPVVSANAFNFWVLTIGGINTGISDLTIPFLLTYKAWGMIIFSTLSAIVLVPFMNRTLKKQLNYPILFLTSAIISIFFFYFNTQMHERYLDPAIIFFGLTFLFSRNKIDLLNYILCSSLYLLNLEKIGKCLNLGFYDSPIFSSRLISAGFMLVIILSFYSLYLKYKNRNIPLTR